MSTSERISTVLRERGEVGAEKSSEGVRSKRKQQMEFNMGDRLRVDQQKRLHLREEQSQEKWCKRPRKRE